MMLAYLHVSNERPRMLTSGNDSALERSILIFARQLPEGVWLATSPDIDGLTVEADTFDELRAEVRAWAPELLRDNHGFTGRETLRFVYGSPRHYTLP